jgi:hypothetical protein
VLPLKEHNGFYLICHWRGENPMKTSKTGLLILFGLVIGIGLIISGCPGPSSGTGNGNGDNDGISFTVNSVPSANLASDTDRLNITFSAAVDNLQPSEIILTTIPPGGAALIPNTLSRTGNIWSVGITVSGDFAITYPATVTINRPGVISSTPVSVTGGIEKNEAPINYTLGATQISLNAENTLTITFQHRPVHGLTNAQIIIEPTAENPWQQLPILSGSPSTTNNLTWTVALTNVWPGPFTVKIDRPGVVVDKLEPITFSEAPPSGGGGGGGGNTEPPPHTFENFWVERLDNNRGFTDRLVITFATGTDLSLFSTASDLGRISITGAEIDTSSGSWQGAPPSYTRSFGIRRINNDTVTVGVNLPNVSWTTPGFTRTIPIAINTYDTTLLPAGAQYTTTTNRIDIHIPNWMGNHLPLNHGTPASRADVFRFVNATPGNNVGRVLSESVSLDTTTNPWHLHNFTVVTPGTITIRYVAADGANNIGIQYETTVNLNQTRARLSVATGTCMGGYNELVFSIPSATHQRVLRRDDINIIAAPGTNTTFGGLHSPLPADGALWGEDNVGGIIGRNRMRFVLTGTGQNIGGTFYRNVSVSLNNRPNIQLLNADGEPVSHVDIRFPR